MTTFRFYLVLISREILVLVLVFLDENNTTIVRYLHCVEGDGVDGAAATSPGRYSQLRS